jgi:capsular exopolysaccharide synthesis family protein
MNVNDVSKVLWHRKWMVVGALIAAIALAFVALRIITPEYRSSSTMSLSPKQLGNELLFFQTLDPVLSIYATAARTKSTRDEAEELIDGTLADISVRTYESTPIFKIDAQSADPVLARDSARAVSNALLVRARAGQIGVQGLELKMIDRPEIPTAAIYPNRKLTYAIAILLGLGFGITAAFLWENLGRRVRTRADLADATGVPVFAEIPLTPRVRKVRSLGTFLLDPELRSVSDALRDLRTNLVFAEEGTRSIVITSPEGRHGKTTVAAGLAVTIARSGARTILVDADLHRSRVAEMLGVEPASGLQEVLEGDPLDRNVRATRLEHLNLLTAGRPASDPTELLASRFRFTLEALMEQYDAVVIDAPPVAPVNDARVIASLAQTTLVVCAAGKATHRSVRDAVERLKLVSVTPTAGVLNMSRSRQSRAYYGVETDRQPGSGDEPVERPEIESPWTPTR